MPRETQFIHKLSKKIKKPASRVMLPPLMLIQLPVYSLLLWVLQVKVAQAAVIALPDCNDTCGNHVKIPFPFGIGFGCFLDPSFEIDCRASPSSNGPTIPFLTKFNIEVKNLRIYGDMLVSIPLLNVCATSTQDQHLSGIDLRGSPFGYSIEDNVFLMEGCAGSAVLVTQRKRIMAGCSTLCHNNNNAIPRNSCYGVECCHAQLQSEDSQFPFYQIDFNRQTSGEHQNCLVATLIRKDSVNQYVGKLSTSGPSSVAPVAMFWNWKSNLPAPDKNLDVTCERLDDNSLYCYCRIGETVNPYVPNGCEVPEKCKGCNGECFPVKDDTYQCKTRLQIALSSLTAIYVYVGIGIAFVSILLVIGCHELSCFVKRRRKTERRVRFFELKLRQHLPSNEGVVERTKIFTNSELGKATDHFNESRKLGEGGQGTVYKGMLTDGRIVAIKKPKLLDENQMLQFINEVVILSQINHRNVVKLLGCCLETQVPLLVYEFIPNGTLSQHIHDPEEDLVINWEMRLKIAADSASAVAYLHSSSSIPIYHRDIKSSNILLDEKNKAKVSDFGISRTISVDQTHLTTNVQGTFGYLDVEYFQTQKFTEKSDVYSFGVVLLELLTGKKAVYDDENMERKSLVQEFLPRMGNSRLFDILDPKIVEEAKEEQLIAVVGLAKRCLSKSGKLRPTMNEVAMTLEMIIKSPEQVLFSDQQAFPDEELGEDVMSEISDVSFMSNPLPGREGNPIYTDVQPLFLHTM